MCECTFEMCIFGFAINVSKNDFIHGFYRYKIEIIIFIVNIYSSSRPGEIESWKALHNAIEAGNEAEFQRLLMSGANFSATDNEGNTALLLAAEKGEN